MWCSAVGWFSVYENLARDDDDDDGLSFLFPRLYSLLMGFFFFFATINVNATVVPTVREQ